MIATAKQKSLPLVFVSVIALLVMAGCDQPANDAVEMTPADASPAVSNDGKMASIDADGNIAPFGMASKQPVPVPELSATPVEEMAAVSAVYATNCAACHGADATGVEGLGLSLVESDLVGNASADELVLFLQAGRSPGSPDSVTGVPMPAFAWMDAADLAEVAGHIKSLQQ